MNETSKNLNCDGPLKGVTVVDLSSVVVGPVCSLTLADYGANVIKIESKDGDLMRSLSTGSRNSGMTGKFLNFNRNKRSIVIDLKSDMGKKILNKIIKKADVFITNMRVGAVEKLKLDWPNLKEINPELIHCQILAFGRGGEYFNRPAYDTVIQSSAGVAATFEKSAGEPRFVPMVMTDHITGLIAAQAIGFALYRRTKTHIGESIEIPMFENMASFVLREHMGAMTFEPPVGPIGDLRVLDQNNKPVKTADGYISISPNTDQQAFAFFDAIGQSHLREDPRFISVRERTKNSQDYFNLRSSSLGHKTSAEWIEIFEKLDIPCMRYNTLENLLEDPHLTSKNFIKQIEHPTEGKIRSLGLANQFSGGSRIDCLPAPLLGQHTTEVLTEFGLTAAEIVDAKNLGVINEKV